MKKLPTVISVVLVVIVLVLVSVVGIGVLAIKGVSTRPLVQSEKELLISASCLEPYGMDAPAPELCETYSAKRNLDGSLGLEYEYDSDKNPKRKDVLYVTSEVEINPTLKDARESFTISIAAYKVGMSLGGGLRVDASPVSLALGDQNYWAVIKRDQTPLGNVVVVRKGNVVHSFIVIGLYFSDPEDLRSLLQPKLEKTLAANLK
jgi:hypothetical protein